MVAGVTLVLSSGCVALEPTGEPSAEEMATPLAPALSERDRQTAVPDDFYNVARIGAEKAIRGYLERSDIITQDSGSQPQRMKPLVTESWYPWEEKGFEYFSRTGDRTVGETTFDDPVLQLARLTPSGVYDVGVIGCVDTTRIFVLPESEPNPPDLVLEGHPGYELFDGDDAAWAEIDAFYNGTTARWGDRRAIVFWLVGDTLDTLLIDSSEEWWGVQECH